MRIHAMHLMLLVAVLAAISCGGTPEPPPAPALTSTPAPDPPPAPPPAAPADARNTGAAGQTLAAPNAAFAEFKEQMQQYIALRDTVEKSVPKLSETKDPKKIADRAALLAAGIRTARSGVKQGAIFTPIVAAEIRRILAADAASRTAAERSQLMAEVPEESPAVNAFYPTDSPKGPAALPSFPANLLAVLPELPETVEYRFLGQALVLRDASANVIVDFLPGVAPARPGGGLP